MLTRSDRRTAAANPRTGRCSLVLVLLLALVSGLVSSCYTAPLTGRSQFIVLSRDAEISLGLESYRQALANAPISVNLTLQERVRRVGMRIVEATFVETPWTAELDWEFTVIEDARVINAWALPGGKVAVYTGILNLSGGDDALLATVLGHEIAHVTIRHGSERITQQLGINIVAAGLQVAMEEKDPETVGAVMGAFGIGTELALARPFGRHQEAEADRAGLRYMARAGYHPAKAIEFWKKMAEAAGGASPPEFLSTHPSSETRLENLQEWQEEALAEYRPAG